MHNIGNLTKGLLGQIFWTFVFAFGKVNLDHFEGNILLLQYGAHPFGAGRMGDPIEFENHDENVLEICDLRGR